MEPEEAAEIREWTAGAGDAGLRLDVFLSRQLLHSSRSQAQKLIRSGCVEIGLRRAVKTGEILNAGDSVRVRLVNREERVTAEDLPLEILFEDEDLLVVNKPAGMVVHVGAGIRSGTLVNALLHHICNLSSAGGAERPGIVHRLDKMTSGLIIVAKNDSSHRVLAESFKARTIEKTYLALVHGRVSQAEGVIDAPIGRDPRRRSRMKIEGLRARPSVTNYHVEERFPDFTLLRVMPRTGRTHQIRVHLASIGRPVVGDTQYGAPSRIRLNGTEQKTLPRNFLHACALKFMHPMKGVNMEFEADLPAELKDFLAKLR
ncbi:MAG: RluA family pseudouridine synthase [Acidobacteriota bacterium]|nr:RluA family pseudouridine synthase [Acidobacteriota bacterium]